MIHGHLFVICEEIYVQSSVENCRCQLTTLTDHIPVTGNSPPAEYGADLLDTDVSSYGKVHSQSFQNIVAAAVTNEHIFCMAIRTLQVKTQLVHCCDRWLSYQGSVSGE